MAFDPLVMDLDDPDVVRDAFTTESIKLYHYTSAESFHGIVTSKVDDDDQKKVQLLASHYRYLNDRGEVAFGLRQARKALDELRRRMPKIVFDHVAERIDERLKPSNGRTPEPYEAPFIASLSKKHNVLSQWRSYAREGRGYCVGFLAPMRTYNYEDPEGPQLWTDKLRKVSYGVESTKTGILSQFRRKLRLFLAGERSDERKETLANILYRIACERSESAKHLQFREECEWRVLVSAPDKEVGFRMVGQNLTPSLPARAMKIVEVWVGPNVGPDRQTAVETTKLFLQSNGFPDVPVKRWGSTFRG
jgi:hypothetical protein